MAAKNFIIDNGGDWKTVETVGKCFPNFNRKTAFTLVVKSVNTVDGGALVVTAQQEEVFGIFYLKK